MNKCLKNITAVFGIVTVSASMIYFFGSEAAYSVDTPDREILIAEIALEKLLENEKVSLDISRISQGYIAAKYSGENDRVKISIARDEEQNFYDLMHYYYGEYIVLPLHAGDGRYEVIIYEHLYDSDYTQVFSETFETEMADELLPFLYPSGFVPYSQDSQAVVIAGDIARKAGSDKELIEKTFKYVSKKIDYDENLRQEVMYTNKMYIPDVDEVLSSGKGICLDYATVMAVMLRSQGIPAKVVIGDLEFSGQGLQRHAWVRAYAQDDISEWIDVDPTYGGSALWPAGMIIQNANYLADYYY